MTALATQTRKRPAGKPLAAITARQQRPEAQPPFDGRLDTWGALEARRTVLLKRVNAGRELGIWAVLELADAKHDLRERDLLARIKALEAKLGVEPEATARDTRVPSAKAKQPIRMSLVGDIRKDRVQTLIDRIKAADPDMPIRLTIDSRGGNLDSAFDLADALVRHKADVHCHALQDCSSAAVVVMLAAKKRTAEPRCHFTLHRPSLARRPSVLADERIEGMLDNSAHSMARMLASRTGTDAEVFRPFLATARGKRLTSAEAVELGVIHALTPHKARKAK